jgi:hypothetical protein
MTKSRLITHKNEWLLFASPIAKSTSCSDAITITLSKNRGNGKKSHLLYLTLKKMGWTPPIILDVSSNMKYSFLFFFVLFLFSHDRLGGNLGLKKWKKIVVEVINFYLITRLL